MLDTTNNSSLARVDQRTADIRISHSWENCGRPAGAAERNLTSRYICVAEETREGYDGLKCGLVCRERFGAKYIKSNANTQKRKNSR